MILPSSTSLTSCTVHFVLKSNRWPRLDAAVRRVSVLRGPCRFQLLCMTFPPIGLVGECQLMRKPLRKPTLLV